VLTRQQCLALAEQARLVAEKAEAQAKLAREQEAWLRAQAEKAGGDEGLRSTNSERIIRTMDVNTEGRSASVKRGAGRATRKHPAQKRLYEKGKTLTDIAAELGEGRPRVSAWFAEHPANRPIPRRHADHLRKKYGIPLDAWLRIAD
jgi:hypothetical protein